MTKHEELLKSIAEEMYYVCTPIQKSAGSETMKGIERFMPAARIAVKNIATQAEYIMISLCDFEADDCRKILIERGLIPGDKNENE